MEIVNLIILILAVWRITNLFVDDSEGGPWQSLHWIRWRVGVRYNDKHESYGTNIVARAMTCFWCWSMWVGIIIAIPYVLWPQITTTVLLPFALSAGALMIKRHMGT